MIRLPRCILSGFPAQRFGFVFLAVLFGVAWVIAPDFVKRPPDLFGALTIELCWFVVVAAAVVFMALAILDGFMRGWDSMM